ncbi:MAG: heavy metal-binding domain-containing protein [Methanobacteriota archaeon]
MNSELIIVSTPYVPGYKIVKNVGFTWGLIVRSRGIGGNIIAGLRTILGGEIHEYTQLLNESRSHALERMKDHAQEMGANAVISVAFDSSEIGQSMTEVLAYGTAVVIESDTQESSPVRLS